MVVPYGDETGSYAGRYDRDDGVHHQYAAHEAATRHYVRGAMPYKGPDEEYCPSPNVLATSLRPESRESRPSRGRHRSLPPAAAERPRSSRRRSPTPEPEDPIRKAQGLLKDTFSNTTSGLGVGILGAIVGGLVAREASDSRSSRPRSRHGRRHSSYHDQERTRWVSTVLGAAVGGLGANAVEKRIEVSREKNAQKEDIWERKWHRDSKGRKLDPDEEDSFEELRGRRRLDQRSRGSYAR